MVTFIHRHILFNIIGGTFGTKHAQVGYHDWRIRALAHGRFRWTKTSVAATVPRWGTGLRHITHYAIYIKSPWLRMFSVHFSISVSPLPPPQRLFLLTSKPLEINLRYLGQRKDTSGEIYWMTFLWPWQIFFLQNFGCVFSVLLCWPYLRIGWSSWCEMKRKCIGWILVNYMATFDLMHDLDLWFFKVKILNSYISGIVGLIDPK